MGSNRGGGIVGFGNLSLVGSAEVSLSGDEVQSR